MEFNNKLYELRKQKGFSQEELANRLNVSRQTISNWENEKSYPDIHNLLLMSVLFNVSLDDLVKGDVEIMRNKIQHARLNKWVVSMVITILLGAISTGPAVSFLGMKGLFIPLLLFIVALYSANKLETIKKKHNLKTYKEIVAFVEGRSLTDEERREGNKNDKFLTILIVLLSAVISFVLVYLSLSFFD